MLVTELLEGRRFEEVKRLGEAERDRFAEIVFRFFFGTLNHLRRAAGDPHPGNYLLLGDGRVGFLDFGLMRVVDADYLEQERAIAQAAAAEDAEGVHAALAAAGYLPDPRAFEPERVLAQIRTAGEWYFTPGFRRLSPGYIADADGALLLAALGLLRGDAPGDRAAAGAADPPHGGARARGARRAARGRRLGVAGRGVLRRRAAVDPARGAGRRLLDGRTVGAAGRGGIASPAMRRTLTLALLLLAAVAPAAGGASTRSIDIPKLFAKQLDRADARTDVPVLLPSTMRSDFARHFPAGRSGANGWRFDIGAARDCRQATACFVAEFRAVRGARPSGGHRIDLPRGRTRPLPPALLRRLLLARRASSGASAARCTRSRRRSPSASSCGWPPRRSATARAEPAQRPVPRASGA